MLRLVFDTAALLFQTDSQTCSSRREEASYSLTILKFEPRHLAGLGAPDDGGFCPQPGPPGLSIEALSDFVLPNPIHDFFPARFPLISQWLTRIDWSGLEVEA